MSLTRKIAYNTLIQSTGRVLSALLGFGVIAAVARHLGQAGFGQYTTVMALTGFFATIAGMGISLVVTSEISKKKARVSQFLSNAFSLRILSSAIILGIGVLFGFLLPYPSLVKQAILVSSFAFFFLSFRHVFDGIFFKELKTARLVVAEVSGRLLSLGLVLLFVVKGKGLLSIIWAIALGNFVQSGLVYVFAQNYTKIRFKIDYKVWRYILSRSWPLALSVALNLIYFKFDTIILSLFKPEVDVGIYGAAYKILELLIAFPILFCNLVLPQLSLYRDSNKARFRRIFQKSFDALVIGTVPLVVSIFFFAPYLIRLVSGSDFVLSVPVLRILSVAIGIMFLASLPAHTIVVLGKQKKMIWAYFIGALLSVATNLIFIPRYSYIGAAATTIFVELLVLVWGFVIVGRSYSLHLKQSVLWRVATAGACLVLFFYLLSIIWNPVFMFLLGMVVYFGILYLIGGINKGIFKEFIPRFLSK